MKPTKVLASAAAAGDHKQMRALLKKDRELAADWQPIMDACLAGQPCTPTAETRATARIITLGSGRRLLVAGAPIPLCDLTESVGVRICRLLDGVWLQVGTDIDAEAIIDPAWGPLLLTPV